MSSRLFRHVAPGAFASLIGVFVGLAITFAWDFWKTSRDRQAELLRATRSVDQEARNNLGVIANDLLALRNDDIAADDRKEVVTPAVVPLLTSAGDAAYLGGSFEGYSIDLSKSIGDVYTISYLINKRIEARDFYRFTSQAMDNFSVRRKIINSELEGILQQQEGRLQNLDLQLVKIINPSPSSQ